METTTRTVFLTGSGTLIDYENFKETDVDLDEIIKSLSNQTRFLGHYDVNNWNHCKAVSALAREEGEDNTMRSLCLYHDAAEAYVGDLPPGLQAVVPGYKRLKDGIQDICYKVLCGRVPTEQESKRIKHYDNRALAVEVFMTTDPIYWKFYSCMQDNPHLLRDIKILQYIYE